MQAASLIVSISLAALLTGCPSKTPEKAPEKQTAAAPIETPKPVPPQTPVTTPQAATPSIGNINQDPADISALAAPPPLKTAPVAPNETVKSLIDKLAKNPKDTQVRIQLASLQDLRGDTSAAEDTLRYALQNGQKTPEIYHALGMIYLRASASGQGDRQALLKGAVEEFKYEVKLNPKSFDGHLNLGRAYTELEMAAPALKAYETALKLDPSVPDVYMGLAFLNNSSERYPYAVKYLDEYIKRSPNKGPGYALLSRMRLNMREYAKAIEAGKLATQTMPESGSSWYILGQAYSYQPAKQDWNAAVDAYQRVIKLVPNWANAYYELGKALEKVGRKEEAVLQYRAAVRFAPTKGRFLYQLGHLLVDLKQTEEGKRIVAESQKYIKLNAEEEIWTTKMATNPKDPENYYQLGLLFIQYQDYPKAKQCLEAVLSVNPKYKDAHAQWTKIAPLAGGSK